MQTSKNAAARFRIPGMWRFGRAAEEWRWHKQGSRSWEFWGERALAAARGFRNGPRAAIHFEFDYSLKPRPAHPELAKMIGAKRDHYASLIKSFAEVRPDLETIVFRAEDAKTPTDPYWLNGFLGGLDVFTLFGFLRSQKPATYYEIGSGHSTRFARASIRSANLPTRIVAIDPTPQADLRDAADEWIKAPFEEVAADVVSRIRPGDVLFMDGSHRSFMNSDVTVFFLEVLPRLPAGVLVGTHDIHLPYDYPGTWSHRYYNEQYLFAAYLLGGGKGLEIEFPNAYVENDPELTALLKEVAGPTIAANAPLGGNAFWVRTVERG